MLPRLRASRKHYQLQSFELCILDAFLHYSYSVVSYELPEMSSCHVTHVHVMLESFRC